MRDHLEVHRLGTGCKGFGRGAFRSTPRNNKGSQLQVGVVCDRKISPAREKQKMQHRAAQQLPRLFPFSGHITVTVGSSSLSPLHQYSTACSSSFMLEDPWCRLKSTSDCRPLRPKLCKHLKAENKTTEIWRIPQQNQKLAGYQKNVFCLFGSSFPLTISRTVSTDETRLVLH